MLLDRVRCYPQLNVRDAHRLFNGIDKELYQELDLSRLVFVWLRFKCNGCDLFRFICLCVLHREVQVVHEKALLKLNFDWATREEKWLAKLIQDE